MEIYCVRELKREIERRQSEIENLRGVLTTVNVSKLDGLPKVKPMTSKPELFVQKLVDAEAELAALKGTFERLTAELAISIVQRVDDPTSQSVLLLRYVKCLAFGEICAELNYSERTVYRKHSAGKRKFESAGR